MPHRSIHLRALASAFAVLLSSFLLLPGSASADEAPSSLVNTSQDVVDATDGVTSLREAITHVMNGDVPGPVTFDSAVFANPATITVSSALFINRSVEIDGSATGVTISGGDSAQVFSIFGQGGVVNVTLKNLTIAHGHSAEGGGMLAESTASTPTITLIGCTFSHNLADRDGGALVNFGANISATNCTFAANQADPNGSYTTGGGAIYNTETELDLYFCTIAFNTTGTSGGGILSSTGTVTFEDTIVADNHAGSAGPDVSGPITDRGFNILGNSSGATVSGSTNLMADIDPRLVPIGLADNGGPTQTIALQTSSPAIDGGKIDSALGSLTSDQRGRKRPVDSPVTGNAPTGDGSDIGAFEYATPVIVNNFANPAGATPDIVNTQSLAQAFTTDGQPYRLAALDLVLAAPNGSQTVEIQLRANNDKTNLPGPILETFSAFSVTSTSPQDIFANSANGGTALSPNTQYWVVLRTVTGGEVQWLETSGTANSGVGSLGKLLTTQNLTATPTWKAASTAGTTLLAVTANPIPPALIVGPDSGSSLIETFDPATDALVKQSFAFAPGFPGGVRVAAADFDGDGIADTVVGSGPGSSEVRLIRGSDGTVLKDLIAFPGFNGGVFVAASDVNGDGVPDMIVAEDASGTSRVKVFSGKDGSLIKSFAAFDPGFAGGVRVAAGDLDGDGRAEIICAAGPGGPPEVKVFSGKTGAVLHDFLAYDSSFNGGVFVACGDVYGSGAPAVITGPDTGGGSLPVEVFSSLYGKDDLSGFQTLFPFSGFSGGCRVATGDINGDGIAELIVGTGPGENGGPQVKTFYVPQSSSGALTTFSPFSASYPGGVYVAGAVLPQREVCPITAAGTGAGKVTAATLKTLVHTGGSSVEQGSIDPRLTASFKLTATPAVGSVFNGWTDEYGSLVGYDQTTTFRMYPGLALQANFIPVSFTGLSGAYHGVLAFTNSPASGEIAVTLSNTGAIMVQMSIGTSAGVKRVSFQAKLLGSGAFQRVVNVPGIGNMAVDFQLDTDPAGPRSLTGTLTQVAEPGASTDLTSSFAAERAEFQDGSCPFAGHYTMRIQPGNGAPDSVPAGIGGVQVKVSAKGKAVFSGLLGDGSRLAATFPTAIDGSCSFFVPLYHAKGYLSGTISFRDQPDSDIDGTLLWVKPSGLAATAANATYPGGFLADVDVLGTKYVPPPAGTRIILDPSGNGTLAIAEPATTVKVASQSNPEPSLSEEGSVTLDPDDFLHLPDFSPDLTMLKAKITRASGAFSGSFQQKIGTTTKTFSFFGAVLQPKGGTSGQANATFIRGDHTGAVEIAP